MLGTDESFSRTTFPGDPITIDPGGMMVPSVTKVFPATMDPLPITAPSMMIDPIPIRQ